MTPTDPIEVFEKRQAELRRLIAEGDQEILAKFRRLALVENLDININLNQPHAEPEIRYKPEAIAQLRSEVDAYLKRRRELQLRLMD
jgi:hypothetical protein